MHLSQLQKVSLTNYHAGVRLAIDCGLARIGVAKCDREMLLATPVATVPAGEFALADLMVLIQDIEPEVIYVGYPVNLSGQETASTQHAKDLARQISLRCRESKLAVNVRLVDERLTTVSAQSALRESGHTAKSSRGVIDQAAAVALLEFAIESERRQQCYAGLLVSDEN